MQIICLLTINYHRKYFHYVNFTTLQQICISKLEKLLKTKNLSIYVYDVIFHERKDLMRISSAFVSLFLHEYE